MTVEYRVLNPTDGSYSSHASIEECFDQIIRVAYAFYVSHTHNIPFSIVTVNPDGSQTWKSPDGKDMPSPEEAFNMMKKTFMPDALEILFPTHRT
jgi:hypothetical protein